MAKWLRLFAGLSLMFAAALVAGGCGVKAPPTPRDQVAPGQVTDLSAEAQTDGVQVVFTVPQGEKPSQAIELVRLYYGYIPLAGDPACPPCPPKLEKYYQFNLKDQTPQMAKLMQGGRFAYLDTEAPMGKQAVYRVVLIDTAGRVSQVSAPVRAYRVLPAAAPQGLEAKAGEGQVSLGWQAVATLADGSAAEDITGYYVWRYEDGEAGLQLNIKALNDTTFVDKTVTNGKTYTYKVQAVRKLDNVESGGRFSEPASAQPADAEPPAAPEGLSGVGQDEGVFLRFSPSPDEDVEGYLVFRKVQGPDSSWVQISEELIKDTTYTDNGAAEGTVYLYRVQAVDSSGNVSQFSEEVEVPR